MLVLKVQTRRQVDKTRENYLVPVSLAARDVTVEVRVLMLNQSTESIDASFSLSLAEDHL